ncbi:hypothetical protein DCAR_0312910 [Daucus carota subsp. sativus]|uniref:Uncharacterized protein n=1 Tax=Daucus carota subsp. sativus TaxID=79200 RepID=A0A166BN85_DAUCS|nr:hypothetical protein DCAR_0312910 [Daucus carota subsp. sativus]
MSQSQSQIYNTTKKKFLHRIYRIIWFRNYSSLKSMQLPTCPVKHYLLPTIIDLYLQVVDMFMCSAKLWASGPKEMGRR